MLGEDPKEFDGSRYYPLPAPDVPLQQLKPRTLPPLSVPPPADPPHLPYPQRIPSAFIAKHYTLTTHLVPAAYPRITPYVPDIHPPQFSNDKAKRNEDIEKTRDEILAWRLKQWNGELDNAAQTESVLWNSVNRYARDDQTCSPGYVHAGPPLTLFFAHANGFPKEIWEPTIEYLLIQNASVAAPLNVAEIWVWEAVNHGDSALINAPNLGGIYDWADNARDILHFLLYYLPSSPLVSSSSLPTYLPRLTESIAHSRKCFGFRQRSLISVGHSFGGCSTTLAALLQPTLFDSMILVDPIIRPLRPGKSLISREQHTSRVDGAIRRRTNWPSRETALKSFRESPFFGVWDPAVLELYAACGLYDDPQGGVSLKMSGLQEAIVFGEALTTYETWQRMPQLDERIELRWIMPGQYPSEEKIMKHALVWRRPTNSSNVILQQAGHLIAQETPGELAREIYQFLSKRASIHAGFPSKL